MRIDNKHHLLTLEYESGYERNVEGVLKILSNAIRLECIVMLVKRKFSIFEFLFGKYKPFIKRSFVLMYSCNSEQELKMLLSCIKVFHYPYCQLLIGRNCLLEKVIEENKKSKITYSEIQKNTYLARFENDLIGIIESLDDEFYVYGDEEMENILDACNLK